MDPLVCHKDNRKWNKSWIYMYITSERKQLQPFYKKGIISHRTNKKFIYRKTLLLLTLQQSCTCVGKFSFKSELAHYCCVYYEEAKARWFDRIQSKRTNTLKQYIFLYTVAIKAHSIWILRHVPASLFPDCILATHKIHKRELSSALVCRRRGVRCDGAMSEFQLTNSRKKNTQS
jgi:hypothetical protein